jgi:hypothetical protein
MHPLKFCASDTSIGKTCIRHDAAKKGCILEVRAEKTNVSVITPDEQYSFKRSAGKIATALSPGAYALVDTATAE